MMNCYDLLMNSEAVVTVVATERNLPYYNFSLWILIIIIMEE